MLFILLALVIIGIMLLGIKASARPFLDEKGTELPGSIWDQREAGKSNHSGFSEEATTVEQFKEDTLILIKYLQEKMGQEKIYLLGHSWGTKR